MQSKRCQNADENISIIKSNARLIIWQETCGQFIFENKPLNNYSAGFPCEITERKIQLIIKQKFVKQTSSLK